jgi:hypothetical protein
VPGRSQVTRPAGQVFCGVVGAGPDPRGQEDLDPGGEGRHPGERDDDLVGPPEQESVDRDNAGKFRLRRLPRVMPPRGVGSLADRSSKNPVAASVFRRATLNGSPVSAVRPRMLSFLSRLVTACFFPDGTARV